MKKEFYSPSNERSLKLLLSLFRKKVSEKSTLSRHVCVPPRDAAAAGEWRQARGVPRLAVVLLFYVLYASLYEHAGAADAASCCFRFGLGLILQTATQLNSTHAWVRYVLQLDVTSSGVSYLISHSSLIPNRIVGSCILSSLLGSVSLIQLLTPIVLFFLLPECYFSWIRWLVKVKMQYHFLPSLCSFSCHLYS